MASSFSTSWRSSSAPREKGAVGVESSSSRKRANGGEEADLNILVVVLKNRCAMLSLAGLSLFNNRCCVLLLLCVIKCAECVRILADNSRFFLLLL